MRANYPDVKLYITNPASEEALATDILAGKCAGAVSTSPNLRYFMNTNKELGCG